MAITLDEANVDGYGFVANGYSADWSSCETIKAAVAGKSIYLTHLTVSCVAAITITVGEGETANAVTTELVGPLQFAATSGSPVTIPFTRPLKLTAATALTADASGAGAATIVAQGFVK
jgi:hypothetical protein